MIPVSPPLLISGQLCDKMTFVQGGLVCSNGEGNRGCRGEMTETKNPGQVGVLVLPVAAQNLNSAPGTKMVLLFTLWDSGIFFLLHGRLILFDKMALNQISQPPFALAVQSLWLEQSRINAAHGEGLILELKSSTCSQLPSQLLLMGSAHSL